MPSFSVPGKAGNFRVIGYVMTAFVAVLIVSNVASSAKIVGLGVSVFGIPLAFDGGTLLFPLSYGFGDVLTEVYGFRPSRRVIWTGFAALAFSSLVFFALGLLPGEAEWESSAGSEAYRAILGGMSSGGLALASLLGYLAGELSNSLTLSWMKVATKGKLLWARTIGSTLIGELLDSVVFVFVATAAGVFARELFVSLALTNYLFKCVVEEFCTPLTYLAVRRLKKAEGVDDYDTDLFTRKPRE
jgi:uncharacterized integral membrane protein (TIGR00697 family)